MNENRAPQAATAADSCPSCRGAAGNISDHPDRPGFFQCRGCGSMLTRLSRKNHLGWEQPYYVDPARPGVTVHGVPKHHSEVS